MSYCLNPQCSQPQNPKGTNFCQTCGTQLLLKNRYRTLRFLGAGGMGRSYVAVDEDTPSKRYCAIKQFCPAPELQSDPEAFQKALELFNREAEVLDRLGDNCPQIPRLLAYLEQEQRLYVLQEFIDGCDLMEELVEQGCFSESKIVQLLAEILPVLKYIHDRGVIHRDIKPGNLMRRRKTAETTQGRLVLIDFGISRQLKASIATQGTTAGTMGYAPPEQLTYGEAYPASDLYALGATCLHLLTGIDPYELYQPQEKRWVWREALRQQGVRLSLTVTAILDKLLQPEVLERFQSADEVLAVLKSLPKGANRPKHSKRGLDVPAGTAIAQPSLAQIPSSSSEMCLHTLTGHRGVVRCLATSPDGILLASGSSDKTIKLWDWTTGKEIMTLNGHSSGVLAIAFSPDGRLLASGSGDKTIKLWQLPNRKAVRSLTGHEEAVNALAFSPDGKVLASSGRDRAIRLWQVKGGLFPLGRGNKAKVLGRHPDAVNALAFSPDGKVLASGGRDRAIRLWPLGAAENVRQSKEHQGEIAALAFSPDGKVLASGSGDNTIKLWQVRTGRSSRTLVGHAQGVNAIALHPNGEIVASASQDRSVKLWQLKTGQELLALAGHTASAYAVVFNPEGTRVASGSKDTTIKIWRCDR